MTRLHEAKKPRRSWVEPDDYEWEIIFATYATEDRTRRKAVIKRWTSKCVDGRVSTDDKVAHKAEKNRNSFRS